MKINAPADKRTTGPSVAPRKVNVELVWFDGLRLKMSYMIKTAER